MTKRKEEVTLPASCGDFSLKQTASYFNRRLIEIMYGFYPTSLLICIMLCSWNNRGNAHMFTWLMRTLQTSSYCWSCIHKGTLGEKEAEKFLFSLGWAIPETKGELSMVNSVSLTVQFLSTAFFIGKLCFVCFSTVWRDFQVHPIPSRLWRYLFHSGRPGRLLRAGKKP